MAASDVRCREIGPGDIDAIATLLTRGFPGRSRDYWSRGLNRQGAREIPDGYPRFGYLLECERKPVGALLLLYSLHCENGVETIRCNVSSWYVVPRFRNYATLLTTVAQRNKAVTYVNISPAEQTWPIIEAQGFRRYCTGLFFALPLLSSREPGLRVVTVGADDCAIDGLTPEDSALLTSHARYGCLSLVVRARDAAMPFILTPKRMRHGAWAFPGMQLVYCRSEDDLVRGAPALGAMLLAKGKPVLIVDANGPIRGLVGYYSESRGRKYFKGPNPPRLFDLTDTEVVLYGP